MDVQLSLFELEMESLEIVVYQGTPVPEECCGGNTGCGCTHEVSLETPETCEACN